MEKKYKLISLISVSIICNWSAFAQQSAHSAGGNASGSGGTAAFSVGQAIYTTASGSNGSMGQGVEQAFVASNPLPLNFQFFTGKCNEGNLKLIWATSFESNNAYFDVEKSENATRWQKIATISGSVNSNELRKYEYNDLEALDKVNYYRIKQIDLDGKFSYSNVISALGCGNGLETISIYPNPTVDGIHLKINKTEQVFYELFDLSGRLVEINPLTESTYISLEKHVASVYFLKINFNNKESKTFKIIKN